MASPEKINIPQKPPMVMVDRIADIKESMTTTAFLIREDNIFVEDGLFREPGLVENMAQSAAAATGANPGNEAAEARIGFIGSIRNLQIHDFPQTGDEILTTVTILHEVLDATIVQAEVRLSGRCLASCELRIFLQPTAEKH